MIIQPKLPLDYIFPVRRLILSSKTSDWCKLKYIGHKAGCPNYGKKDTCPPKAPHITDFMDTRNPMYLVHSKFDLEAHMAKMKAKHPHWTERQCKCVLYWQSTSRKQLKEQIALAYKLLIVNIHTVIPEAMGVNVYATASINGLKLQRIRNMKICKHVALVGWKRGSK